MKLKFRKIQEKINPAKAVLLLLLIGMFCLSSGEQNIYFYKGFLFKHPYFENKSLYTAQSGVFIEAPEIFQKILLRTITYSGVDKNAVGVFVSGDSLYLFTTSLVQDFCYYVLNCTEPQYISLGSVTIDSSTAIYALKNSSIDIVRLCVSSSGGRIFILSINTATKSVVSTDSFVLSNADGRIISSVSGNSVSYKIPDSLLWVTGSNGLLRSIRVGLGSASKDSVFDISATETVNCYGDGVAGTASGSIFERKGSAFEKVFSVQGAIRSINARSLAGNGVVSAKTPLGWTKIIEESSARYRECIVSANSSGALYEVIDEQWGIDTIHGTNSNTQISSITPAPFMNYVNSSSKYSFNGNVRKDTLWIKLTDFEKNYQPLSIVLNNGTTSKEVGTISSETQLANNDPSRECTAGKMSLADSVIQIILTPGRVTISASMLTGRDNVECQQCILRLSTFKSEVLWEISNELSIRSATQTLVFVNNSGSVTSLLRAKQSDKRIITICKDRCLSSISLPQGDEITDVSVFDLSGKRINSLISGNNITLQNTGSGIVTVKVHLKSGNVVCSRTVLTQR